MERDLADLNKQKLATEARLKKVSKDQKVAAASSKEIADLKKLKADLESQISELNSLLAALKSENEKLNESIASLTKANKELEDKSALLAAMVLDNYRVEASKGKKGKLTITARKTNKLSVGFDLPSGIAENIKFRITTPAGKTIHENDETIGMKVVDNEVLVASLSPLSGQFEVSKRVEMTYKPQERLQSGIYKIDIYNNSTYVGSCQIKLR
jgi:DNA repair exonuclease SbcCD ATPase subunit